MLVDFCFRRSTAYIFYSISMDSIGSHIKSIDFLSKILVNMNTRRILLLTSTEMRRPAKGYIVTSRPLRLNLLSSNLILIDCLIPIYLQLSSYASIGNVLASSSCDDHHGRLHSNNKSPKTDLLLYPQQQAPRLCCQFLSGRVSFTSCFSVLSYKQTDIKRNQTLMISLNAPLWKCSNSYCGGQHPFWPGRCRLEVPPGDGEGGADEVRHCACLGGILIQGCLYSCCFFCWGCLYAEFVWVEYAILGIPYCTILQLIIMEEK